MRGCMKAEMTTGSIVVRVTGAGVTGDGGAAVADEPAHPAADTTTPTATSEAPMARPVPPDRARRLPGAPDLSPRRSPTSTMPPQAVCLPVGASSAGPGPPARAHRPGPRDL